MYSINWNKFKIVNENNQNSFEDLSYHLFCRRYKRNSGVFRYKNQVGIEVEPIQEGKEFISFQTKWFESKINKNQIIDSIRKAKDKNSKLSRIIFYINQEFIEGSKEKKGKLEKSIDSCASQHKLKIEWVVKSHFESLLSQPANLDLAQLYFDLSDEFGFINSCLDSRNLTFLQSSEYIKIPFFGYDGKKINNLATEILKNKDKISLITGHPGSGKSISMHMLCQVFAGLDKNDLKSTQSTLNDNGAIPMLINLKNCSFDTLENLIRNRQRDYKVRKKKIKFIYLLDGLDELSTEKADIILSYLYELKESTDTKKIIISCRSGNPNRIKVRTYFKNILECKIGDLVKTHIDSYFKGKGDSSKIELLKESETKNQLFLVEVRDALLVKLLWETIEELSEDSTILDLLDKKIKLLIFDPRHAKNIEDLNLLIPKESKIIEINKKISVHFQKKFQFRLSQEEIQVIILDMYPRMDYDSVNTILDYIVALFFDGGSESSPNVSHAPTFAYQHRRYQDFFFIQELAEKYDENPIILRKLKVLSNRDYFENLFLPYLRKEYSMKKNLPGIIELNLIEVYMGNHSDFGADNPCYQNSSEFIPSLAAQDEFVLEELLADESLAIEEKISFELEKIKNIFIALENEKNNYRPQQHLEEIWNNSVPSLLEGIVIFWRSGKQDVATKFNNNLDEIIVLFRSKFNCQGLLDNPPWKKSEDYLYLRIVIRAEKPSAIFKELFRKEYKKLKNNDVYPDTSKIVKEDLLKSFFRVCVDSNQKSFSEIIEVLDNEEFLALLDVLVSEKNLLFLVKEKSISEKIKTRIEKIQAQNIILIFCKKLFGIEEGVEHKDFLKKILNELKVKSGHRHMHKVHFKYAIVSYILNQNPFGDVPVSARNTELDLYAALFMDYTEMIGGTKKIETVTRNYIRNANHIAKGSSRIKYLEISVTSLWAHIFANAKIDLQKILSIKNRLKVEKDSVISMSFYLKLQEIDQGIFVKIINQSELRVFEDEIKAWDDDYSSYVSCCFNIASLFANIDKQKAILHISNGINHGMIRHGWRKDGIVSYMLVDALGVLWKNNWASQRDLEKYTKKVFDLAVRVNKITDQKVTWRGPYNIIDLVSRYDIGFAILLKNDLRSIERQNFLNKAVSSILDGKIRLGLSFEEIEEAMTEYQEDETLYQEKFKIYFKIAKSDFYTEEEKIKAFGNAYQLASKVKNRSGDLNEFRQDFEDLCRKHDKKVNITFNVEENQPRSVKITEKDFIDELSKAKTFQKINGLYVKLNNYDNSIVLKSPDSWRLLLKKTYEHKGNIKLFISLLEKYKFPHDDFFFANSKYLHYGLGAALEDTKTKEEILKFLLGKKTGYGGFINVMKSYEFIGDQEMCLKLFKRYLQFCDFLVN